MPDDRDFCREDGRWFVISYELILALITQRLSGTEWDLLMMIMKFAYGNNKEAFADLNWSFIKEKTGLQDGTIRKARNKLIKRNILSTIPQDSKRYVRYRINSKSSTWKKLSRRTALSHRTVNTVLQESASIKEINKELLSSPLPPSPEDDQKPKKAKKGKKAKYHPPCGAKLLEDNPWLNVNAWDEFVTHRENIKHPLTELAVSKAINLLEKHRDMQQDIVDKTILNNYRGLFEPKAQRISLAEARQERKRKKWERRFHEHYAKKDH